MERVEAATVGPPPDPRGLGLEVIARRRNRIAGVDFEVLGMGIDVVTELGEQCTVRGAWPEGFRPVGG